MFENYNFLRRDRSVLKSSLPVTLRVFISNVAVTYIEEFPQHVFSDTVKLIYI